MSDFPSNQDILELIRSSGYLMEQEIATILEENGYYYTRTNVAFKDVELKKSRETDVVGLKRILHDEENMIDIFVEIICECKNNRNPFVFIGRKKNEMDKAHVPEEYSFPIESYEKTKLVEGNIKNFQRIPAFFHLGLDKIHHYYNSEIKYIQFSKIVQNDKKWSANHEGIFDSILYPIIKSFLYQKRQHQPTIGNWKYIHLYFPIVVLNASIFAIDTSKKEYSLEEKEYLTLIREIDSDKIKGEFLVDFVDKNHFGKYLNECVENFINGVKMKIEEDKKLFLQKEI